MLNSHHHAAAAAANMYPWYRDSMSQLGQFCGAAAAHGANIKTENGYNDCMLALDYAQTKAGQTLRAMKQKLPKSDLHSFCVFYSPHPM